MRGLGFAILLSLTVPAGATELAVYGRWLPTPGLTPGFAGGLTARQLCAKGFRTGTERPAEDVTEKLKIDQLKVQSRYSDKTPAHYEEDHLISLEIGGSPDDPRNLWPQPYAGKCGAHVKDKLENRLHSLVCRGKVTLQVAQDAIAGNWIAAYNRYVGRIACR